MDDALTVFLYRQHRIFERTHRWRESERERWGSREWGLCRELADTAWELNPAGLYLWAVERSVWNVGYLQGRKRLEAAEAATRNVLDVAGWGADPPADMAGVDRSQGVGFEGRPVGFA